MKVTESTASLSSRIFHNITRRKDSIIFQIAKSLSEFAPRAIALGFSRTEGSHMYRRFGPNIYDIPTASHVIVWRSLYIEDPWASFDFSISLNFSIYTFPSWCISFFYFESHNLLIALKPYHYVFSKPSKSTPCRCRVTNSEDSSQVNQPQFETSLSSTTLHCALDYHFREAYSLLSIEW